MRLVYFSPVPWASFAQRPHKFVDWYHERTGGAVLWVEPYATRFPRPADFKRLSGSHDVIAADTGPDWLEVLHVNSLPIEPLPWSASVNTFFWRRAKARLLEFSEVDEFAVVVGKPSLFALGMLDELKPELSVYDAMDDFPVFYSGLSRLSMAHREVAIARSVGIVMASSTRLQQKWSDSVRDVRLVRNGLDPSVLPQGIAKEKLSGANNVFGYVGTIADWFDWDWVFSLAEGRSEDEVRLIGPCYSKPRRSLPPNMTLLPPCDHARALELMLEFDVGLIPFKKSQLTASVDPIKYYEYRAVGLPVITTAFGEMEFRRKDSGVFVTEGVGPDSAVVDGALSWCSEQDNSEDFVNINNWYARFDSAGILPAFDAGR